MLGELKKEKVFFFFEEISKIPRESFHTDKIRDYLIQFAKERQLIYLVDSVGNVVIKKPGSPDNLCKDAVILQGHVDMVCETVSGKEHDFQASGISLIIEDDYIRGDGTTLGADNGVGVAMILALLDRSDLVHPPIEALFTVDEEVGMIGADAFDASCLSGKYLINLDSEEEGSILVSCAGGVMAKAIFQPEVVKTEGTVVAIKIGGLQGGHSGIDVEKNHYNGSNLLARFLFQGMEYVESLIEFQGGDKDNVITREASAKIVVNDLDAYSDFVKIEKKKFREEFSSAEPDLFIEYEMIHENCQGLSKKLTNNVLQFLNFIPVGVQVMSSDMEGLVESSLNMGVAFVNLEEICFGFSVRSQKASYKEYMIARLAGIAELTGGTLTCSNGYPAWDYKKDSLLRDVASEVFHKQYGYSPEILGIHAGLECGIFFERMDNLDIISIGAETLDIHSPAERLSISSTRRVYEYVKTILLVLARDRKEG